MPDGFCEPVAAEGLQEEAAVVGELSWGDLEGAFDLQLSDVHQGRTLPSASTP